MESSSTISRWRSTDRSFCTLTRPALSSSSATTTTWVASCSSPSRSKSEGVRELHWSTICWAECHLITIVSVLSYCQHITSYNMGGYYYRFHISLLSQSQKKFQVKTNVFKVIHYKSWYWRNVSIINKVSNLSNVTYVFNGEMFKCSLFCFFL